MLNEGPRSQPGRDVHVCAGFCGVFLLGGPVHFLHTFAGKDVPARQCARPGGHRLGGRCRGKLTGSELAGATSAGTVASLLKSLPATHTHHSADSLSLNFASPVVHRIAAELYRKPQRRLSLLAVPVPETPQLKLPPLKTPTPLFRISVFSTDLKPPIPPNSPLYDRKHWQGLTAKCTLTDPVKRP